MNEYLSYTRISICPGSLVLVKRLIAEYLEQLNKHNPIFEVSFQNTDGHITARKEVVDPSSECLCFNLSLSIFPTFLLHSSRIIYSIFHSNTTYCYI